MTKEYIFTMAFEDGDYQKEWTCIVYEDKCETFAEGEKCQTFRFDTTQRKPHVLQLDTEAKVFDEILPLQVENGIPFRKMDGKWECSDTTDEDRLQANIRKYRRESYLYCFLGLCFLIFYVVDLLVMRWMVDAPIGLTLGLLCIVSGVITMVRLNNEMKELGRKLDWKFHWSDFKKYQ